MTTTTRPRPRVFDVRTAAVVVLSTALLALLAWLGPTWLRVPYAVAWFVTVPGLPWALRMRLADAGDTVVVTIALSMGITAIVGGAMALLALFWPALGAGVLGAQALAGALLRPAAALSHRIGAHHGTPRQDRTRS